MGFWWGWDSLACSGDGKAPRKQPQHVREVRLLPEGRRAAALPDAPDGRGGRRVALPAAPRGRGRRQMNNELNFPPNVEGLVLGCIDADFFK